MPTAISTNHSFVIPTGTSTVIPSVAEGSRSTLFGVIGRRPAKGDPWLCSQPQQTERRVGIFFLKNERRRTLYDREVFQESAENFYLSIKKGSNAP